MKYYLLFMVVLAFLFYPDSVSATPDTPLVLRGILTDRTLPRTDSFPPDGQGARSSKTDSPVYGDYSTTTSSTRQDSPAQRKGFGQDETDKQNLGNRMLHSIVVRGTFARSDVIGGVAPENFREYGLAAHFRLPWSWYSPSDWGVGLRLMTSAGALYSDGESALVVSLIPLVVLGSKDGRFNLDLGAGGALLSRRHFGKQDYGGYFQFALTAGVSVPLFKRLGMGYRFMHYSDAGIYGPENTGADMHMFELICRF